MPTNEEKIAQFLQTLRKAKGLTQQQVADYLHISNKTVSKWETGQVMPDILTIKALAELYEVSVDELLNGSKNGIIKQEDKEAVLNLLVEKTRSKINNFLLITLIVISLGNLICLILASFNYSGIGLMINLFLATMGVVIYVVSYININKKELANNEIISLKTKHSDILISILSGTIIFSILIGHISSLLVAILDLLIGILIGLIFYFLINKKTYNIFFKIKLAILTIIAAITLGTIVGTIVLTNFKIGELLFVNDNSFLLYSVIFCALFLFYLLISIFLKQVKYVSAIFSLLMAIVVFIMFFIGKILLNYYLLYAIVILLLSVILMILDSINKEKTMVKAPNPKILLRILLITNISIIMFYVVFVVIQTFSFVSYGSFKGIETYYYIYYEPKYYILGMILPIILALISLFIPIVKRFLAPVFTLIGGIAIYYIALNIIDLVDYDFIYNIHYFNEAYKYISSIIAVASSLVFVIDLIIYTVYLKTNKKYKEPTLN